LDGPPLKTRTTTHLTRASLALVESSTCCAASVKLRKSTADWLAFLGLGIGQSRPPEKNVTWSPKENDQKWLKNWPGVDMANDFPSWTILQMFAC